MKLHRARAGNSYQDGFYMIQLADKAQYLPVYCDMTTEAGAFTLLVTSAHNGWTPAQVLRRYLRRDFEKYLSNAISFTH